MRLGSGSGNNGQGGPVGIMQRPLLTEPVLSPILTDTEISPLHRTGIGSAPDYLTDPSDSDDADMFTSQATQGYSEGLADNELESEVSSVFGLDPSVPDLPRNHDPSGSHISPLEYSAMLKLYRSAQAGIETRAGGTTTTGVPGVPPGGTGGLPPQKGGPHLKDTTPDSGVVPDNNNSNSNSNQSTASSNQKQAKLDSSQNSLLSSSSSTAAEVTPIWQQQLQQPPPLRNGVQASSIQHLGKEYSRLEGALNQPDTLFSSEGSSSASEAGEETTTDKPSFRWDGTPLVDKTKESKLVKKVKSLDQQESGIRESTGIRESGIRETAGIPNILNNHKGSIVMGLQRQRSAEDSTNPPIPPIRESCVKSEEFKKDSQSEENQRLLQKLETKEEHELARENLLKQKMNEIQELKAQLLMSSSSSTSLAQKAPTGIPKKSENKNWNLLFFFG